MTSLLTNRLEVDAALENLLGAFTKVLDLLRDRSSVEGDAIAQVLRDTMGIVVSLAPTLADYGSKPVLTGAGSGHDVGIEADAVAANILMAVSSSLAALHRLRVTLPGSKVIILCPKCRHMHVDAGDWAKEAHKTHLCGNCWHQWQPYAFPTIGVAEGKVTLPLEGDDDAGEVEAAKEALRRFHTSPIPPHRVGAMQRKHLDPLYSTDWRPCEGQTLSKTTYPEIWDLMSQRGFPWGGGDTQVGLPDTRIAGETLFIIRVRAE